MNKYENLKNIGVWIDDSFSKIDQAYVNKLKECNINTVSIMVNKSNTTESDTPWELRAKKQDIIKSAELFNKNNIEVSLTCWPQPSKSQIDKLIADMSSLLKDTNAKWFEIDTESNWHLKFLKEFASMEKASDYLVKRMREVSEKQNLKLSLTTFPYHAENSKDALVAQHMDLILPQAYSVRNRREEKVDWGDSLGPGNIQELTMKRAKKIPGFSGEYGCGLAAYDQEWPSKTGEEAMKKALDKVIDLEVTSVYYWSSKWIIGSQADKNQYAAKFLKSIK